MPRSRTWIRRSIARLLAMSIGLLAGLALLEIGLRAWGWPAPGLYQDGRGPLATRTATADGGYWRATPGPGRLRHYDYDVAIRVNTDGFREREPAPKADGERRIGLLGDSFTAGVGVEAPERFGDVWFAAARAALPEGTTLWNLGAPGTGTAQSAAFLAAGGASYDLDEIILAFYAGNDLIDNEAWSRLRAMSPEELRAHDRRRESGVRLWLRAHCRTASFLWIKGLRALASREPLRLVTTRAKANALWPHTERALDELRAAAGDRPLTIWYLPALHEWDDAFWAEVRSLGVGDDERAVPRERLRAWAEAHDVGFVDATPALAGKTIAEIRFAVDPHWNASGHALVGRYLASAHRPPVTSPAR